MNRQEVREVREGRLDICAVVSAGPKGQCKRDVTQHRFGLPISIVMSPPILHISKSCGENRLYLT